MYDALLRCNYTTFEISLKPYLGDIHKIYAGYVHLKAFFFSEKRFTWPLAAHIPLKELLFFSKRLRMAKVKSPFYQELTYNIKTSYCAG